MDISCIANLKSQKQNLIDVPTPPVNADNAKTNTEPQRDIFSHSPISHTSTQCIDFVDFLHFNGSVYQLFCSF